MDLYTTLPWTTLCAEVARLNVSVRCGQVIALRSVSSETR
jgi:hypothetical protein